MEPSTRRRTSLKWDPRNQLARARASGTPPLSFQTDICGAKRPTQALHLHGGREVPLLRIEIVKRSDDMKGFVLLPRRWVVERTSQEGKQSALRSSHLSRNPCPETLCGTNALCPGWRKSLSRKAPGCFICERGPETSAGARRLRATKPKTCRVSRSSGSTSPCCASEAPRR